MKKNGINMDIEVVEQPEWFVSLWSEVNKACDKFFERKGIVNTHAAMKDRMWSNSGHGKKKEGDQ